MISKSFSPTIDSTKQSKIVSNHRKVYRYPFTSFTFHTVCVCVCTTSNLVSIFAYFASSLYHHNSHVRVNGSEFLRTINSILVCLSFCVPFLLQPTEFDELPRQKWKQTFSLSNAKSFRRLFAKDRNEIDSPQQKKREKIVTATTLSDNPKWLTEFVVSNG